MRSSMQLVSFWFASTNKRSEVALCCSASVLLNSSTFLLGRKNGLGLFTSTTTIVRENLIRQVWYYVAKRLIRSTYLCPQLASYGLLFDELVFIISLKYDYFLRYSNTGTTLLSQVLNCFAEQCGHVFEWSTFGVSFCVTFNAFHQQQKMKQTRYRRTKDISPCPLKYAVIMFKLREQKESFLFQLSSIYLYSYIRRFTQVTFFYRYQVTTTK